VSCTARKEKGEFERLVRAVPSHYRLLVETFIETGMRWGEVIALRPRHVDFLSRMVRVEDTIVETSKKNSPTGERFLVKPYPKNNEPRTFGVRQAWLDEVAAHIRTKSIGRDDLLFATRVGTPISRNSFRTQVWLPAVKVGGVDFTVRVHDLRHAHASWLLAGGSDLRSVMDRMSHHQIQTTQKYLPMHCPRPIGRISTHSSGYHEERTGDLTTYPHRRLPMPPSSSLSRGHIGRRTRAGAGVGSV
jgi:integrase